MFNAQFPINVEYLEQSNMNDQPNMSGQPEREGSRKKEKGPFDLEERTALFSEAIIGFAKSLPVTVVTRNMITQLVGAGTSIGANYAEANEGVSKKDFRNKIGISKKEANETKYWLRMLARAVPERKDDARPLWQEAKELHLIFSKIFRSCGSSPS